MPRAGTGRHSTYNEDTQLLVITWDGVYEDVYKDEATGRLRLVKWTLETVERRTVDGNIKGIEQWTWEYVDGAT